jgi:hypothetical protein
MSQKSQADQHTVTEARPEVVAVEIVPSASPVLMMSVGVEIYVVDQGMTKWIEVSERHD